MGNRVAYVGSLKELTEVMRIPTHESDTIWDKVNYSCQKPN